MTISRTFALTAILTAIPLVAVADQHQGGGEAAPAQHATGLAALQVESETPYGRYLVDAEGRTLYMFTPDAGKKGSTCYGACAEAWPPLLTTGDPRAAAAGLEENLLGTVERRDGSLQVTYAGWPLYYFVKDKGPGQVTGQDVHSFGGGWYLLSPAGTVIKATRESKQGHEHHHESAPE